MTLELVDGFDQYGLDEEQMLDGNWTQLVRADLTQDVDEVRTGTTALEFSSTVLTASARRNFEFQDTSKIVCFAFRVTDNLPSSKHRLRICKHRRPRACSKEKERSFYRPDAGRSERKHRPL